MEVEKPSEPDSTTFEKDINPREFSINDDVLVNIDSSDQMWLGNVIKVNNGLKKCLVKFLDSKEVWCCYGDMKLLSLGEQEQEVICVVCKASHNKTVNPLVVCICGRGYHQLCHDPHIPIRDTNWRCKICGPVKIKVEDGSPNKSVIAVKTGQVSGNWDGNGRDPSVQECYCGKKASWSKSVLQCRRCRQWFHSKCVRSIDQTVFPGDRFYALICSGCNRGKELCVRLAMTWPDLVYIAVFNLTLLRRSKYFELDSAIMPFINQNWDSFTLPPALSNAAPIERRVQVERALLSNEKRFKSGKEKKKRTTLWGLRGSRTPRAPPVTIPPRGPILDLKSHIKKHMLLLSEPPLQNGFVNSSKKDTTVSLDVKPSRSITPTDEVDIKTEFKVESSTEYHGRGLVKRSVPFPMTEPTGTAEARFRSHAVRRAARLLRKKKPDRTGNPNGKHLEDKRLSDSEDEALRTLMGDQPPPSPAFSFLPKSTNDSVRKRPQRNLLEARLNSTESKLYNPQASVEDPKKRPSPAAEVATKKKLKKGELVNGKTQKKRLIQTTLLDTLQPKAWKREVKPLGGRDGRLSLDSASTGDEVPEPRPLVIVKKRLSEKDIIVDRNGQVRRRRMRPRRLSAPLPMLPSSRVLRPRVSHEAAPIKVDFFNVFNKASLDCDPFGPRARIRDGEAYEVMARRVLYDGTTQVLLHFPKS